MLLKKCRYVVTQDSRRRVLEHVDILIEGNVIREIGDGLSGEPVLDCSERIVMPGLINAHTHLGMTSLRGISDDDELKEWLAGIVEREGAFADEDIEEGNHLGMTEALRTGTTTIVDMYFRTHLAGGAAESLGVRYLGAEPSTDHPLGRREVSRPDDVSDRVTFGYGPHAIYSEKETDLREAASKAEEESRPLMIHVSETRKERADAKRDRGMLPVEYLQSIGFLSQRTMLLHCNWLTKGELDLIGKHGASVVHCPQSNMKLAGGSCMPVREMRERGINVALGTDSVASNNSLDMFREMHTAALLHKHHYWDATVIHAQDILDMATVNGAKAIGREDLGSIEAGKLADIITLDLDDVNLIPNSKDRIVSHLVYAASGMNVSDVIVDGKLIVSGKVFV